MNWFFIALIGPFLYAIANHIDKYLLSKYIHESKVGALIILSALFGICAMPIIFILNPLVLSVSIVQGLVLMIAGCCVVISILCYLYSLQLDEATLVVPFYQTIPIFGFILAYFVLGETLSAHQLLASSIILLGTLIISFDIQQEKVTFKRKVVILMLTASFFYAASDVLFKLVAIDRGFWISTFWTLTGKVITGIIFLIFVASYRKEFLHLLKKSTWKILGLNSSKEGISLVADAVSQYAILLAPIALVMLVNGFQPLFVFIIGILLTFFFPHISKESVEKNILIQKFLGISVIIVGSLLL